MIQLLRNLTIIIAVLYFLYIGVLFLLQREMLYPGRRLNLSETVATAPPGWEIWSIETSDGLVEAWFHPAPTATESRPGSALIYAHGNGEVIDYWPEMLSPFLEMGVSLLLVEYPGYGRSAGTPSQTSVEAAMLGAYDQLVAHSRVDQSQVIVYGRSLGGGAAGRLATNRPVAALILQSTFSSVRDFAPKFWAPRFLIRDPFDNTTVVRNYAGPVLIIHGSEDTLIPVSHAETLYQQAQQATLKTYPCEHNDCPQDDQFWADISDFLRQAQLIE